MTVFRLCRLIIHTHSVCHLVAFPIDQQTEIYAAKHTIKSFRVYHRTENTVIVSGVLNVVVTYGGLEQRFNQVYPSLKLLYITCSETYQEHPDPGNKCGFSLKNGLDDAILHHYLVLSL